MQLGLGVAIGLAVVGVIRPPMLGDGSGPTLWLAGVGVSAALVVVGPIECLIPVRRALRVQPTEALHAGG